MNKSPEKIQKMFNSIANKYDKLNSIISFGTDKLIKKQCIKLLSIKKEDLILDLCTGTGDLTQIMAKYSNKITGIDFSQKMLEIAKNKNKDIQYIYADCTNLPFQDNSFNIITISYGLRNIENSKKALKEIYRVLKPNGKFLHLDFGEKNFFNKIFNLITPLSAKIFSDNPKAYQYLINSKQEFLEPEDLINKMKDFNFELITKKDFLMKTVSCQIFTKKSRL